MNRLRPIALALAIPLALGAAASGCKNRKPEPGPYPALQAPASLESSSTLVLLDASLQGTITIAEQRASYTPDNRLVAEANIRNLIGQMQNVQVQTVFKDANNLSSGDETAWQTMVLNPNAIQTYRATALNDKSSTYTIRIRIAR